MLGYYVFDGFSSWLADDEKTWSTDFTDAACFSEAGLAADIGAREAGELRIVHVFGLLPAR